MAGGVFQGSLLDLMGQAGPGPLGESVRRRDLAHGAWVDVRPGWLAGADELFGRLLRAVPWRAERRHMYDRVVDVHIGRIRKKVEDNAATPILIVTVRGAGYRFEDESV